MAMSASSFHISLYFTFYSFQTNFLSAFSLYYCTHVVFVFILLSYICFLLLKGTSYVHTYGYRKVLYYSASFSRWCFLLLVTNCVFSLPLEEEECEDVFFHLIRYFSFLCAFLLHSVSFYDAFHPSFS